MFNDFKKIATVILQSESRGLFKHTVGYDAVADSGEAVQV